MQARIKDPAVSSPIVTIAHIRRSLEPALATYRWHEGHTLQPYHDGATDEAGNAGAFADMMKAIDQAQTMIFIVDWSFHPFFLPNLNTYDLNQTIGARLIRKAAAGVAVAIHTWDHTNIAAADTQNDNGDDWFKAMLPNIGVPAKPPKLRWRASSPSGIGYSHHQKFVIVDEAAPDGRRRLRTFFGGLDLTKGGSTGASIDVGVGESAGCTSPQLGHRRQPSHQRVVQRRNQGQPESAAPTLARHLWTRFGPRDLGFSARVR